MSPLEVEDWPSLSVLDDSSLAFFAAASCLALSSSIESWSASASSGSTTNSKPDAPLAAAESLPGSSDNIGELQGGELLEIIKMLLHHVRVIIHVLPEDDIRKDTSCRDMNYMTVTSTIDCSNKSF
jgi:hypothetical protein